MVEGENKRRIIISERLHERDTGSPFVQIALLTAEIADISGHLLQHKKDFSGRRGLLRKVGRRRRLLKYVKTR